MVEWLEQLDYGAEGRREVVSSRLGYGKPLPLPCVSLSPSPHAHHYYAKGDYKSIK